MAQEKRNNGSGVCISCSDGGRKGVGGPHESLRKSIHPCPHPHRVTPRDASSRSLYRCCTRGRRWSSSTRERWTLLCLATPSPSNQETTFTSNRLVDTLQYLGILSDYGTPLIRKPRTGQKSVLISGTPLIWKPWGQKSGEVSYALCFCYCQMHAST